MEKRLDIIYNLKHIVIVPVIYEELYESINDTFGNAIIMKNNIDDVNHIIKFINQNNIENIIFTDYFPDYNLIMNGMNKEHKYQMIYTKTLASLSDEGNYLMYREIIKLCENNTIDRIGIIDPSMFEVLSKKAKAFKLLLNVKEKEEKTTHNSNTIGILNIQDDDFHSFYNELSAVKQITKKKAKIRKPGKVTNEFIKSFNIPVVIDSKNTIRNNCVNLEVNFTETCIHKFLKSMNLSIPCIVGNNSFLTKELEQYLMVRSDDNIDEITEKINFALDNKDKIMKAYNKFKKEYDKKSEELVYKFIGYQEKEIKEKKYSKLLSVIVPVYNVEQYLENSLNSIINAAIDDMEILVINDGSTDNSKKIAKDFAKRYPNLIKYIEKENGGLGSVRNVGLKEAKGKYLAAVDSDDTINVNFFKEAEKYLKEDIDLVICDWLSINEDKTTFETAAIEWSLNDKNKYEGLLFSTIMPSTCNKIMKKSILDELNEKYIEDKYEDLSLNPLFMLKVKTLKYINKPYYEYYLRSGSLMRTSAGYSMINIIKELNQRINKIKNETNIDIEEFKFYTFSWRIEEFVMNQLYNIDKRKIDKYIKTINDEIFDICKEVFESIYYKEMLDNLKDQNIAKYIKKRNTAFSNKKLKEFIENNGEEKNKLTPVLIYYGK